jgi:hypothetical protein
MLLLSMKGRKAEEKRGAWNGGNRGEETGAKIHLLNWCRRYQVKL